MTKKSFIPIPPPAELPQAEIIDIPSILDGYLSGEYDLICVVGPTASGKTRYAVNLAREINLILAQKGLEWARAEIISADSRQVYRGMSIGTGKDLEEYDEIPYHLIDIVEAGEKYNIFEYQRDFQKVYLDLRNRGCIPILCGGSGLYVDAVTKGYSLPEVPPDEALRSELDQLPTESLIEMLASLKPLHNSTDYDSRKRLIRAIEIAKFQAEHPVAYSCAMPQKTYFIGTLVDRETRNARIDARLEARLEEGLVDEVKALMDKGIRAEDLIYYGLEYKFVTLYLTKVLNYDEMRTLLATAIHQFAKRQMTWFRGMERRGVVIHWTEV